MSTDILTKFKIIHTQHEKDLMLSEFTNLAEMLHYHKSIKRD
jgi:hypothetical protein